MSDEGDRLIIKTMRFAVWGLAVLVVLFAMYVIAEFYIAARLGTLEHRVEVLERNVKR